MAGANEMGLRIASIAMFGMLASFAVSANAFAQAGSVGGSIGKTDKSVSGEDAPRNIRPAKQPSARANAGSPCQRAAGSWMWRWLNDHTVVTLSPDGASSAGNGNKGNWTCKGSTLVISWGTGGPDKMILSPDAKTAAGTGTLGVGVTGTRTSGVQ
jgi:hypothetical protein